MEVIDVILWGLIISFAVVLGFGCGAYYVKKEWMKADREKTAGTLHIETSDPDGPYLFAELKMPIRELQCKTDVIMAVDTRNYVS